MRIDDLHAQQRIDQVPLMTVRLNPRSRDEKVKLIRGLQGVYADVQTRQCILDLIAQDVIHGSRRDTGRPGMDLWSIFVLLATREALQADYDELEDLAAHHTLIRAAMGIGGWEDKHVFDWTQIWRNVRRVRAETVAEINRRVLQLGHQIAPSAVERVRIDSFVMRTNAHHPSDLRQTGDGLQLVIRHAARLAEALGSTLLRQHEHLARRARQLVLVGGRASASKHRDRAAKLAAAARAVCDFADERCAQALLLVDQAHARLGGLEPIAQATASYEKDRLFYALSALATCAHVVRERLVMDREVALSDRLFSIFEPHTELIYRGKVPVPVEFGHRILVAEDAAGFIVHAEVMTNGAQDRDVAVPVTRSLKDRFPTLAGISFDRGFHSPDNQRGVAAIIPEPCLPTTGEKALTKQMAEVGPSWRWMRRRHAGVEAAIGNLEDNHGCRRCPDKGRDGYERFLQTAVLAHNIMNFGRLLWAQDNPDALPARTRRRAV